MSDTGAYHLSDTVHIQLEAVLFCCYFHLPQRMPLAYDSKTSLCPRPPVISHTGPWDTGTVYR